MDVRPIKSQADYEWALKEIEAYFDNEPEPGTPDGDRFDVLADLIEAYENRTSPIEAVTPTEALKAFMTIDEATDFFAAVPSIREKFATLQRVGLGYVKVGQPATTLSGGEAQRVKLSKELSRRATGRTLYMLDEPTTGLHFHDIKKLLEVLHELVDAGNTVVVIEHNLEVIKTADWIIDMITSCVVVVMAASANCHSKRNQT